MTFMDPVHSDIAASGEHRRGEDRAPAKYKDAVKADFRDRILETMSLLNWAFIGTVSERGWPLTSASRFVLVPDDQARPVTYVIVPGGSLVEAQLRHNPRVGFEAHLAVGWLERRKARAVQIQALAAFEEDAGKAAEVEQAFRQKYRDDPAFALADTDRLVCLTPLSIVNFYPPGRPQWGYVDYTAE